MVINFSELKKSTKYREKLMTDYLVTNVDKEPYGNIQYIGLLDILEKYN